MGELLRLWQTSAPHTYTVPRLLSVLDQMVSPPPSPPLAPPLTNLSLPQGMKSLYEWVELMTKDRVEQERLEQFVRRSNTPAGMARLSRPLSLLTDSSGLSQSSCSPPGLERRGERRGGGVFTTLYRPGYRARQSCYIPAPTINLQPSTPTTPRPQSAVLQNFDRALAEYNQLEGKKKRTNIETEKYFDNLAALLR